MGNTFLRAKGRERRASKLMEMTPVITRSLAHAVRDDGWRTKPNHTFELADAVRASAIFVVFSGHLLTKLSRNPSADNFQALGYWGVDAFFVLSGFLLGRPYIDAILGRRAMPNVITYFRRRFLRIWPTYAFALIASIAIAHLRFGTGDVASIPLVTQHTSTLVDTILHLIMVHNLCVSYILGGGNAPLWTMAVDAEFYLVLPLAAWTIAHRPDKKEHSSSRILVCMLATTIGISLAWRLAFAFSSHSSSLAYLFATQRGVVGMGTCFAAGSGIALAQARDLHLTRFRARNIAAFGLAVAVMMFSSGLWIPSWMAALRPTILDTLGTVSVSAIILGGLYLKSKALTGALSSKTVSRIAANSYALYLVHWPLISLSSRILQHRNMSAGSLPFSVCLLVMSLTFSGLAAFALHRYIEAPFLSLKSRLRETTT
jgi:peptidoglycan/LPS O-acetylase OafA/YrhL